MLSNSDVDLLKFKEYILTRVSIAEKNVSGYVFEIESLRSELKTLNENDSLWLEDLNRRHEKFKDFDGLIVNLRSDLNGLSASLLSEVEKNLSNKNNSIEIFKINRRLEDFGHLVNSILKLRFEVNGVAESIKKIEDRQSMLAFKINEVNNACEKNNINLSTLEININLQKEQIIGHVNSILKLRSEVDGVTESIEKIDDRQNMMVFKIDEVNKNCEKNNINLSMIDSNINLQKEQIIFLKNDVVLLNGRVNKLTSTTLFVRAVKKRVLLRISQFSNKIRGLL